MGADNCWNIDRIMRLPGTLNVPDAKKIKKGRKVALASLVEHDPTRVYDLSAFTAAPRIQSPTKETRGAGGVKISGNLAKVDLNTLEKIPAKLKNVIIQGDDPDEPDKWPSRSEALFYVCCELVRLGIDDETIAALITDREFRISDSVLEKPHFLQYAARQIRRAKEQVECPELRELNDVHAVISDVGGKCRVMTENRDIPDTPLISLQTFEDFRNRYLHRVLVEGKKREPLGNWWLKHPRRRQFDTIIFAPGEDVEGVYNLWRGFAYKPTPGHCDLFLAHVRDNICAGNTEHFDYLLNWMARAVQHPDLVGEVAVVLRGDQGTGKGIFAREFGALFGAHFLPISDARHLVGNFNEHLRATVVLFADEAFFAGDKKHHGTLKYLITEPTFPIEPKGRDVGLARNQLHIIMASNNAWVIPAGSDERRFFVLDVASKQKQQTDYFAAISREMESGGRAALLHLLLVRDIRKFEVRTAPKTTALLEQKLISRDPWEAVMHDMLVSGITADDDFLKDHPSYVSVPGIIEAMSARAEMRRNEKSLSTVIGSYLKKWVELDERGRPHVTRINRRVAMIGGRATEPPEGFTGLTVLERRNMFRLKPLNALRAAHTQFGEAWPAHPGQWTYEEELSEDEKAKQYEMSMLDEPLRD